MRISVKGVSVYYDSVKVLDDVNLRFEDGQVTSIAGPNGSGKTTLLRCISNMLKPKVGSVLIDDVNVNKLSRNEIARKMGYVPQSSITTPMTAFEIVLMGRKPYVTWSLSEQDREIAFKALESVGAEKLANRYFDELSGGEKQKIVIARALAQEPQVLLLDEPTSNLDLKHQLEILNLIKRLSRDRYICIIMAMHDLNLAYRFSDFAVLLKDGRVFAAGKPNQVFTRENIKEVYNVEVIVLDDPHPIIMPLRVA